MNPQPDHNAATEEDDLDWDDNPDCMTCNGDGWGYLGEDFENDDPVNEPDGQWLRCPNCGGSGLAEDQQFW